MKTTQQIKQQIEELRSKFTNGEYSKRGISEAKKRIARLDICLRYLETNPRKSFIENTLNSLIEREKTILNGFDKWKEAEGIKHKDPEKAFHNNMKLPELKEQINNLKYILE